MPNRTQLNRFVLAACMALLSFSSAPGSSAPGANMNTEPRQPDIAAITRVTIEHFNEAFNRHDADALAYLLTDDTVFENTSPPPDGQRIEGKAAVVAFWREWFARNPDARFEAEEIIVSGDRA
ncbi:MAG: nuclear transport factor 2 family protein, partial [Acidobacteriaceae bacterium]|nr:nuclear transport factor 2 family protein [Acidobacteriaceae bacterium]